MKKENRRSNKKLARRSIIGQQMGKCTQQNERAGSPTSKGGRRRNWEKPPAGWDARRNRARTTKNRAEISPREIFLVLLFIVTRNGSYLGPIAGTVQGCARMQIAICQLRLHDARHGMLPRFRHTKDVQPRDFVPARHTRRATDRRRAHIHSYTYY